MKVQELFNHQIDEGVLDYIKGAARSAGQKVYDKMAERGREIAEPFRQMHAAGKQASVLGGVRKQVLALAQAFATIQKLTPGTQTFPESYVPEGLWDYLRGATGSAGQRTASAAKGAAQAVGGMARRAGQSVAQTGREIHAAGQQASAKADEERRQIALQSAEKAKRQATSSLIQFILHSPDKMLAYNQVVQAIKGIQNEAIRKSVYSHFITVYKNAKAQYAQDIQPRQGRDNKVRVPPRV